MVLLSVIITFCKQKEFVKKLIESVIFQKTNFNFEIVVGIDGENDGTEKILNRYKNNIKNFYIYKLNSNKHLLSLSRASNNRLFLLKQSHGKYFIIIDGDDFFISYNRFQKAIDFLEVNDQYIGHACARMNYHSKQNFYEYIYNSNINIDFNKAIHGDYIHVSQCVFRNIFLTQNIQYFDNNFFNDRSLFFFMVNYGKIWYEHNPMFAYRIEINSIYNSQPKICQKFMSATANIINYKINSYYQFRRNAIKDIIYILLNYKKNLIPDDILNAITYQDIPLLKDIVFLITHKQTKPKLVVACLCMYYYFMYTLREDKKTII